MISTQKHPWLFLLLAALAGLAMLFAACGGGDDDNDSGGDDTTATATATDSGDDGGDDGGDEETPTDGGDNGDDGGDDDVLAEIENLAGEYENVTGTVTYSFSTDGSESTWTIYSEGDKSRTDFLSEDGGFISITTPEASYTCTESAGEGFCFAGDGGVGTNPFAGLFGQYGSSDAILAYAELFSDIEIDTSSEEIAGVDASCYSASGDFGTDSGSLKWCFADNGLLLLSSYQFESGTVEMQATEFSHSVPDDAFEPPYDVTEIPGQ